MATKNDHEQNDNSLTPYMLACATNPAIEAGKPCQTTGARVLLYYHLNSSLPILDRNDPSLRLHKTSITPTKPKVYALLDRARAVLARQAAIAKDEAALYDRSDYLDPSRSLQKHSSADRRKPTTVHNVDDDGTYEEAEDPASHSFDEIQRSHNARAMAGAMPGRPRTQAHHDSLNAPTTAAQGRRKRALPTPTTMNDSGGGRLRDQGKSVST